VRHLLTASSANACNDINWSVVSKLRWRDNPAAEMWSYVSEMTVKEMKTFSDEIARRTAKIFEEVKEEHILVIASNP
jgi:hypothetical protein